MDPVTGYKTFRTTMGHRIRVRMSAEEIRERKLFRAAVILMPFIGSALTFFLWVKVG